MNRAGFGATLLAATLVFAACGDDGTDDNGGTGGNVATGGTGGSNGGSGGTGATNGGSNDPCVVVCMTECLGGVITIPGGENCVQSCTDAGSYGDCGGDVVTYIRCLEAVDCSVTGTQCLDEALALAECFEDDVPLP